MNMRIMKEKLLSHSLKEEIKDKRGTNCFANLILMLESNIKTIEMWSSGKIIALNAGGFSSIFGIIPYKKYNPCHFQVWTLEP